MDADRPLVVEAESSRIGERFLPPALWGAMQGGRRIELSAPLGARVAALARTYDPVARDPDQLAQLLARLPGRHGRTRLDGWLALARGGEIDVLVCELLTEHYDPAYRRSGRAAIPSSLTVALRDLGDAAQDEAADTIARFVAASPHARPTSLPL